MTGESAQTFQCPRCKSHKRLSEGMPLELIDPHLRELIVAEWPDLKPMDVICRACINHFRAKYFQTVIEADKGELSELETEVLQSVRDHELLSHDPNEELDSSMTVGERIADRVAAFGGSWRFIIGFGCLLAVWIAFNTIALMSKPFDPYPYILLNLVLSCLAALQAPVIMMSQNRRETKDRSRSEHDYQINLKAELEIRHINLKIDQLIHHQWQRLLEIQKIQLDLVEELGERKDKKP